MYYWQAATPSGGAGPVTMWGGVLAFVVLAGGLFLVWKNLGSRTDRVDDNLGKRVERVEDRLGDRIGRVEKRLMNAFYQVFGKLDVGTLSRSSPLGLNSLGRVVTKEIRGAEWAERVASALEDWIGIKDAYQIQEDCFDFVESFAYTEDELRAIRDSAFRNGLPTEQVRRVLAIELRDRLLRMADLQPPE